MEAKAEPEPEPEAEPEAEADPEAGPEAMPEGISRAPRDFPGTILGARKDGNFGILLDKKSPKGVTAWQMRWCVINPEGHMYYFANRKEEEQCRVGANGKVILSSASKKAIPIDLSSCERITSDNEQRSGCLQQSRHLPRLSVCLRTLLLTHPNAHIAAAITSSCTCRRRRSTSYGYTRRSR
jgi:hypothetical protein